MSKTKVEKIDFSRRRLKERAEKYYGEGDYCSALRFAHEIVNAYGGDGDTFTMLADIYESMGLYASAINHWFRFMDDCAPEDLPEIYEGLAVGYLNLGNEAQSAFYYNKLMDEDDSLTEENKSDIAATFLPEKRAAFRFVYPPELADYTKETKLGGLALQNGDLKTAVGMLSKVEKGSKEYPTAREMQAVAYLLGGDSKKAEQICLELIEDYPQNVQAVATLSAVYMEQDRKEESRALAETLCRLSAQTVEEKYKIATVACENGLHKEALALLSDVEKEMPYDGNVLYFKAVAAFNSGEERLAARTLEKLCDIYPDASVAQFYLKEIRKYLSEPEREKMPETTYFYRVSEYEREVRCRALVSLGKRSKEEAAWLGKLFEREGYFTWCFDELDGMEQDLQYLGVVTAEKARLDRFLRDVLLDIEVKDILKIEILRLLYCRNEENLFGVVLCNIYRSIDFFKLSLGVKKRNKFLNASAVLFSRFAAIADGYGAKVKNATESLYAAFKRKECWELAEKEENIACALYFLCGFTELGKTKDKVTASFDADGGVVEEILNEYFFEEKVKE